MPEKNKIHGVNLGGWLVLEKWMTPSVFEGTDANDEYALSLAAKERINKHRSSFITKQDFKWIAKNGFNAVRLPVGHWIFGGFEPYIASEKYVDKAFEWAKEFGLQVLLDLHTAPGSQNGYEHSGQAGEMKWHTDPANIAETVNILGKIAKKYGRHPNLYGIEVLNEPHKEIALSILQNFYRQAYQEVRKHCAARVKVIFSDAYKPTVEWTDFLNEPGFEGVLLDLHMYQTHYDRDRKLNFEQHITKTLGWKDLLNNFDTSKLLIGEWSAVLHEIYNKLPPEQAAQARQIYKVAQEYAYADTAGTFYWTYKTENADLWNYRSFASGDVH